MEATELRPMSIGELLDRTFRLYRNHFWLFVGIMAIPSAISIPFSIMIFSMQGSAMAGGKPSLPNISGMIFLMVAFFCFFWAVYSMALGAATYAVSESYLGHTVTVRGSYGKVRGNVWRILGVVIVAWIRAFGMLILGGIGIAILIGLSAGIMAIVGRGAPQAVVGIVGVVVGIVFGLAYLAGTLLWILWMLRYSVSISVLLLENAGVLASLRRSVQLTKGRRWQIFVAVVLCMVIAYAGVIIFQGPFFVTLMVSARTGQIPEWLTYVFAVSGAIGGAITGPVLLIVLVLCYYDTRIRKEAFDLQYMMSALTPAAPPAPASDAGSPV
jgi:hypothetical protein